jgi:hypothetical protein
MQDFQPTRKTQRIAALACTAAFALAGASAADAQQLTERAGDDPAPQLPQVGDRPADRAPATESAPPATTTQQTSNSADDDGNAPLLVGVSLVTVALLGSGTYVVRRRRHMAPGA